MRPLKSLTDEDFNNILIEHFKIGTKCYPLAKKYKVDNGNLSRVLKRKDVIKYYEENLNES